MQSISFLLQREIELQKANQDTFMKVMANKANRKSLLIDRYMKVMHAWTIKIILFIDARHSIFIFFFINY